MAPANIWICSVTRYFPDPVASVQYFAGTNSLGVFTNGPEFLLPLDERAAGRLQPDGDSHRRRRHQYCDFPRQ